MIEFEMLQYHTKIEMRMNRCSENHNLANYEVFHRFSLIPFTQTRFSSSQFVEFPLTPLKIPPQPAKSIKFIQNPTPNFKPHHQWHHCTRNHLLLSYTSVKRGIGIFSDD
jgi:hypothetical protein